MWILTVSGFYSVVQKPGDAHLTIRARVAEDLDRLRNTYLPDLGPTVLGAGTDYSCRAVVDREALATAMADIVRDVTYANFKSAVSAELGPQRAHVYHDVWAALHTLQTHANTTTAAARTGGTHGATGSPPKRKKACYGGVVLDASGRILLRKPRNEFDNYVWTFAKGGPEADETAERTALREVLDETGVEARIVGELPGWFESGLSATRFYVMRVVRDTRHFDNETSEVIWVDAEEAVRRVSETRNVGGRRRDLRVLEALAEWRAAAAGR